MKSVGDWLDSLGLARYADDFELGDIDWDLLPELDHDVLKEIGVDSPGDRLRILKAAKAIKNDPEGRSTRAGPYSPVALSTKAERRQLTVMFCDLVGSTALSARLDPEEMRDVITAYQHVTADVITRFEGHVARFMGDGVLAYFGWPQAHEDDAERAVRAALTLVESVGTLGGGGAPLAVRIGIATGKVVVGDLIGEGAAQEQAVVGQTPNLAARLQQVAEPGCVIVAPTTRRLLGGQFELAEIGPQRLKGFSEPVRAFRVTSETRDPGRFVGLHGQAAIPMVGREHELGILLDRWALAETGEGQVVLLSGEPGIGKSRLVEAALACVKSQTHTRIRCYSSPFHANNALHPVIDSLARAAGFLPDDSVETKLHKLEENLCLSGADVEAFAPYVAHACGISTAERYPALDLSPQSQKAKTFEGLLRHLEGMAAQQPVLIVLEDAHWVDPTTNELFGHAIERARNLPTLIIVTFRPEFIPPWTGHAHVTSLSLSGLGRRQGVEIVGRLTGGRMMPAEVVEEIMAKTDGVPLFVEELTRSVIESDLLIEAPGRYELTSQHASLAIPETLHDSLMARLDRLGEVKEVAQTAAVIGREFSHELLRRISPLSERDLNQAIDRILGSDLIHRRGNPPEVRYTFKHALVQESAYESLLKSSRQALHSKIASALETSFPQVVGSEPELIAHHLAQAGDAAAACEYFLLAGEREVKRSANAEAIAHLETALRLLESLPDDQGRRERELRLLTLLGPAQLITKSRATAEVAATLERTSLLARELKDIERVVPATLGLWYLHMNRGDLSEAASLTDELFDLARGDGHDGHLLQAHHAAWTVPAFTGDFEEVCKHVQQGLKLYDRRRHGNHAFVYIGHDPFACAQSVGSLALWMLGFPEQALEYSDAALAFAAELGHAPSLVHALSLAGNLHVVRGDIRAASAVAERLHSIARELDMTPSIATADCLAGWAMMLDGAPEQGFARLEHGIDAWRSTGARIHLPQRLGMLADGLCLTGRLEEALDANEEASRVAISTGERWFDSLILWQRANLLRSMGEASKAVEKILRESIETATRQRAKSAELRAATSLATLMVEENRYDDAREVLQPVYTWFGEGFESNDLVRAKALIDELA